MKAEIRLRNYWTKRIEKCKNRTDKNLIQWTRSKINPIGIQRGNDDENMIWIEELENRKEVSESMIPIKGSGKEEEKKWNNVLKTDTYYIRINLLTHIIYVFNANPKNIDISFRVSYHFALTRGHWLLVMRWLIWHL